MLLYLSVPVRTHADVAQLAEQLICNLQVAGLGSIVGGSSKFNSNMSCADVAQLAEQLICNQQVAGSSPIVGSILF